jgi:hypothetical protein
VHIWGRPNQGGLEHGVWIVAGGVIGVCPDPRGAALLEQAK